MSLSQTVALVTGGSSGLGAATVRALRQQGARVWVADLQPPTPATTFQFTNEHDDDNNNDHHHWSSTDVTDPNSVQNALDAMEQTFGQRINACIQCAGIATARKTLSGKKGEPHPLDEFTRTLHINTIGTFNVARLAAERMQHNDLVNNEIRGTLIHTASIAAYEGQIGQVAYATSKAAIVGMTLPMARDLAPLGIRCMTIVRGWAWQSHVGYVFTKHFCLLTCVLVCFLSLSSFFFYPQQTIGPRTILNTAS
jgi:3-hydroxyacyl-CoA dehydrogenase/3-hydroxy-2-methylbutyryl-CoA dehydrogenase